MIQELIVLVIVVIAAGFVGRHLYRNFRGKSGCDGCGK